MAEDYIKKAEEYVNNYIQNPQTEVNYNDDRLTQIKQEQAQKENQMNNEYNQMINNSDKFYQQQIDSSKEFAEQQKELQNQKTQQIIESINQNKDKTQKDYIKEQKGAYADYQKQIDPYGINAEKLATSGLSNSGYSETSKVSMYNTYQNRVATAREVLNTALINYNNSIKEAQISNNVTLAEIAAKALQNQQELALKGFKYKNTLIQTKQQQLQELGKRYDTKYQNKLNQINTELASKRELFNTLSTLLDRRKQLQENIRQANAELALKREQLEYQRQRDRERYSRYNSLKVNTGDNEMSISKQKIDIDNMIGNAKNLVNIANNSQYPENRKRAKEMLPQYRNAIIKAYEKGKITEEEANRVFDIIG